MADLSLAAKHLLKLMQMDGQNRFEPLRSENERAAVKELQEAGLVIHLSSPDAQLWALTLLGYDTTLTKY